MPIQIQGIGVSRGIVSGPAFLLPRESFNIVEVAISDQEAETEVRRYHSATRSAVTQLQELRDNIADIGGGHLESVVDMHIMMLKDSSFLVEPVTIIKTRLCNAEWALKLQRDSLVQLFEEMDDHYLRSRKDDIVHVSNQIFRNLLGSTGPSHEVQGTMQGAIAVAEDITPADIALLSHSQVAGIISGRGGPLSHSSILARNLNIPAVSGVLDSLDLIRHSEDVILDGREGIIHLEFENNVVEHYGKLQRKIEKHQHELEEIRHKPSISRDKQSIQLLANIDQLSDIELAFESGAEGVGLFRTELLFLGREEPLNEEEQYEIYVEAIQQMKGLPLTIRTLDLGADKAPQLGMTDYHPSENPALGLRAIRLCINDLQILKPQIRALLRASVQGHIQIMIPMITSLHEVDQVRSFIQYCLQELKAENRDFKPQFTLGGMIEVPAAAMITRELAARLDFVSIGTNDLIQYTLAIDRADQNVNYLYDPFHPAVLRLIYHVIKSARRAGKPVVMCGEMAGDSIFTRLLLGMGLTRFSMHPNNLLEVRQIILDAEIAGLQKRVRKILTQSDNMTLDIHSLNQQD